MRCILLLSVFAFLFVQQEVNAQVVGEDLPFLSAYRQELPYFQELITGGQYASPPTRIKGDPYFTSRQFEEGILRINGITYPQVPLIYDTYHDQLITFHPIFNQKILIKPEKIDGFTLSEGQLFRFLQGMNPFFIMEMESIRCSGKEMPLRLPNATKSPKNHGTKPALIRSM